MDTREVDLKFAGFLEVAVYEAQLLAFERKLLDGIKDLELRRYATARCRALRVRFVNGKLQPQKENTAIPKLPDSSETIRKENSKNSLSSDRKNRRGGYKLKSAKYWREYLDSLNKNNKTLTLAERVKSKDEDVFKPVLDRRKEYFQVLHLDNTWEGNLVS